jgi:hypothetical protein
MAGVTTHLSILTLNVNGLPHQKTPFGKMNLKGRPNNHCLQETYLVDRNNYCLKVKGLNGPPKMAGV